MNPYTNLAKKAVESYILRGEFISPPGHLPQEMLKRKAGVFVTLRRGGALCGCIGTFQPLKQNIAQEIIRNAIAAAVEDYRFGPVEKAELPLLSYEVSILSLLEKVESEQALNPKRYGILVKTIGLPAKSALLLPELEGIDTAEKQLDVVCQKGGIDREREKIEIFKFTVEKHQ